MKHGDRKGLTARRLGVSWLPRITDAFVVACAVLATAAGLVGCGDSSGPVAVQVGDVSIGTAAVNHWASAIKLGNAVATSVGRRRGTPREKALDFLISSQWLIGEAAEHRLAAPDGAVEHHLRERIESVPNGRSEFAEELSSTGQTISDVKLEIRAELAAAMLREMVSRRTPPVTRSEIADYYRAHSRSFYIPDLRVVDLIEEIPTRAAAIALGRRLGPGKRFARRALHERVPRESPAQAAHLGNGALVRGIFQASPGVVASPAPFNGLWVLIVVRKVMPGRAQRLSEVESKIARLLADRRRRQGVAGFAEAYQRKWTAKTSCRPGFIVQGCSQYHGAVKLEGDPLTSR